VDDVYVFSLQDGVPYQFHLGNPEPGWFAMWPTSKNTVTMEREAHPHERVEYLRQLPRFFVIATHYVSSHIVICVPLNPSDAEQRGWPNAEPRPLHLVTGSIESGDVCVARGSDVLYFETVDTAHNYAAGRGVRYVASMDGPPPGVFGGGWRPAAEIVDAHAEEVREKLARIEAEKAKRSEEYNIMRHIEFMGARLHDWRKSGDMYTVSWEYRGRTHTVRVSPEMRIMSAGVCLSGRDLEQNLSSIVKVMDDHAEHGGRYGWWREY
jgi:hypothetical protein